MARLGRCDSSCQIVGAFQFLACATSERFLFPLQLCNIRQDVRVRPEPFASQAMLGESVMERTLKLGCSRDSCKQADIVPPRRLYCGHALLYPPGRDADLDFPSGFASKEVDRTFGLRREDPPQ